MMLIHWYRIANWLYNHKIPFLPTLLWRVMYLLFNSSVPASCVIGKGTVFAYGGIGVVDVKATLFDGSYHDVDSSEAAYKIAASMALKEAARKCDPVILEPIMKVEVTVPEQYYGDVIGDISKRRGNMTGESQRGNAKIIDAFIPLSEMFGYVTDLRSFTQGRGSYSMSFDHFGETPRFIADEIIKKSGMSNR